MKIFIGYGQDHNAELIERIRRDLEAEGYTTWIDRHEIEPGIEPGDGRRRRIVDGLRDTDWMSSFCRNIRSSTPASASTNGP